ncbi:Crp/Fnr family transcriptional regulator [Pelagibacterium halotolerans]|uniref:Crp/Fnr family transcriptional regulator n=1 Tax=Pelagibacterium halotolerans TaxID=531813 RepID=UPI00384E120D
MVAINSAAVRHFSLFEKMDAAKLDEVLAKAAVRHYPSGTSVFEQGEDALNFFVLLEGRLKVTQVTEDGQQVIIRIVNPGELFGFAKALQRMDYPGTATAAIDSVALAWPMSFWSTFIEQHAPLATSAMQTIGQRLQESHVRLREMATEEVERRVAHAVLRLADQSGKKEPDGIRIDFPLSKQDIAEMTGTTLHTVSRIMSAWQEKGLVKAGRQKLLICNPDRLLMLAEGRGR